MSAGRTTVALVDSGLGSLGFAEALRVARPDLDLVLSLDPDHMPWGSRSVEQVTERVLAGVAAAVPMGPDAVVIACNTGSVRALSTVRARLEPAVPVIGTVPAIRPAAATGGPVAVWATPSTTGSSYQRDLIARFASGVAVQEVSCPGFAAAVEVGELGAVDEAIAAAVAQTRADTTAVVLGCTHYPLVRDRIQAALPAGTVVLDSTEAVARQTLVRLAERALGPVGAPADGPAGGPADGPGRVTVLLSGRPGELPAAAAGYAAGRRLLPAAGVARA